MERDTEAQVAPIQKQIKVRTEMVNQPLKKKQLTVDLEDPYVAARIPFSDLTAYPELNNVLPSIEEDFFSSSITKKEGNVAIHSFLRTSSMNYIPPPLDDTASSTVMKTDSALYGIQIKEVPGKKNSENTYFLFSSIMRSLLAEILTTVTQLRLDNLHLGLDLLLNPTKLID
ncbi:hypothetical protein AYI68_g1821 [Smittium mucronatum]|uniref:Uncharacterized protein n=1 Tax=Smittium mucronatum TaxID=133383 RepID=A0A1R0H4I2_9FUNG|nr:hypothetical protein AYI68_g1821 [Smittium mucronatum]